MRRRAVSALTAAVLVTSLAVTGLTGCGSGNDGKESVRLMVWSPQGDQSVDQGQWLQTCCNAFAEEHPEWDITFVYGVADEASSAGQVSQDAEASADVFLYANDNLSVFSEEDVENLDTMLEKVLCHSRLRTPGICQLSISETAVHSSETGLTHRQGLISAEKRLRK